MDSYINYIIKPVHINMVKREEKFVNRNVNIYQIDFCMTHLYIFFMCVY